MGHEVHLPLPVDQEALRDVRKASEGSGPMSTLGLMAHQPSMVPDPEEWAALAATIRRTGGSLFWELFSGMAVLTQAFVDEGWEVGPPIDINDCKAFNLLDPGFFTMILGLILEGHIAVLHLGPPCSSFSMAFNRFPSQRIRSAEYPQGLPGLNHVQQEKVDLGNTLAERYLNCR